MVNFIISFANKKNYFSIYYLTINIYIPVSSTTSVDIIANSVSLCGENSADYLLGICLKKADAIQQIIGVPPETLNTIQTLAESINNNGTFNNTIIID